LVWSIFDDKTETQPGGWTNTECRCIPKDKGATTLGKIRWLAKLNGYRQWYHRTWKDQDKEQERTNDTITNYGTRKDQCTEDITWWLQECLRKADRWHHTPSIVVTMDIRTSFDLTKHKTLHQANEARGMSTTAKLTTMKDHHNKTAAMTLNGDITTHPFDYIRDGWQGRTRTPTNSTL
jgi:hypothetical protein